MWVFIPRQNGQAILWLKLVTIWRVIDDYDIFHATAHSLHILHKLIVEVGAVFTEETLWSYLFRVQYVHQWNRILRQARSEDDHLVVLAYL